MPPCIQDLRPESVSCKHPHQAADQRSAFCQLATMHWHWPCATWTLLRRTFSPAPSQHWSGLFIPSQGMLALFLLNKGRWEQTQTTLQRTVTFPLLLKPKGQLHSLFLPSCSWINHSSCPPRDASYFAHGSDFKSLLPPSPKILNLSEVPP